MKRTHITALPAGIVSVDALCIAADGAVLLVSSDAKLWRTTPRGVAPVSVTLGGKDASVWDVSCDLSGTIRVVASGADGLQVAGVLTSNKAELRKLDLGKKEPRRLVWSPAGEALWFTATDTTLNTQRSGKLSTEKDGRYNAIVASPKGAWIAARRIDTNAIVVRAHNDTQWTTHRASFQGQVVGVSDNGDTWLLEVGQWSMGKEPGQSRLLRSTTGKDPETVLTGPIQTAAIGSKHLALIHRKSSGLALEVVAIPIPNSSGTR